MFKYLFSPVPNTMTDNTYRKVLRFRSNCWSLLYLAIFGVILLLTPNPAHATFSLETLLTFVSFAIFFSIVYAINSVIQSRKPDAKIHEMKINESDERRNSIELKAAKLTLGTIIAVLFGLFTYFLCVGPAWIGFIFACSISAVFLVFIGFAALIGRYN
ncbi:hypothetical protein OZX65_01580 [Leuconostocaceae bacterium ESL0723]|nr:hypothetical protein OZX65_01580 [Leuconostocaceae bacterium ESL0723]